ncbi:MAG: hypothetical protein ACR2O6_13005 [Ilumatobacteraceae bacterium]
MNVRPWVIGGAAGATVLAGWWLFESEFGVEGNRGFTVLLTGAAASLLVPAVIGACRRPSDRTPTALAVTAVAVAVSYFRLLPQPWAATIGAAAWYATPLAIVWLATRMFDGTPRVARWLVWTMPAVLALGTVVVSGPRVSGEVLGSVRAASWADIRRSSSGDLVSTRQLNPLAHWPDSAVVRVLWVCWAGWVLGASLAFLVGILRRARKGGPPRPTAVVLAIAIAVSSAATAAAALPEETGVGRRSLLLDRWFTDLVLALPMLVLAGFGIAAVWTEIVQPRLAYTPSGLRLAGDTAPAKLRRHVEHVLGDPTARLLFSTTDGAAWVDEDGRPTETSSGSDRAHTVVTRDGAPVAVIEYDISVASQPDLVDLAVTSAALTLESRRLAALAEHEAADARASATRILTATERGRNELRMHVLEGPDRRLAKAAEDVQTRPVPLAEVHENLRAATADLRAIAHGTIPLALYDHGLAEAIEDVAATQGATVDVTSLPPNRLDETIEVTIVVVIADVLRKADDRVSIGVHVDDETLVIRIEGADEPSIDVRDRIDTLGGALRHDDAGLDVVIPLSPMPEDSS